MRDKLGPECSVEQEASLLYFPEMKKLFTKITGREPGRSWRSRNKEHRDEHLRKCMDFWDHMERHAGSIVIDDTPIKNVVPQTENNTVEASGVIKIITGMAKSNIEKLMKD